MSAAQALQFGSPFQAQQARQFQPPQQRQQVATFAPQYEESYQPAGRVGGKKKYPTAASIQAGRQKGAIAGGGLGVAYGFCSGPLGMLAGGVYGASLGLGIAASMRWSKQAAWLAAGVGAVALGLMQGGGGVPGALIGGLFGAFNGYQLGGLYAAGGLDKYLK